jgi:hypothetical protein
VIPLPENSHVADIRFTPVLRHADTMFPRLDIPSVRWEARSRADRMAKYCQPPATAVPLRDLRHPAAVPAQEQRHRGHPQAPTAEILREALDGLRQLS